MRRRRPRGAARRRSSTVTVGGAATALERARPASSAIVDVGALGRRSRRTPGPATGVPRSWAASSRPEWVPHRYGSSTQRGATPSRSQSSSSARRGPHVEAERRGRPGDRAAAIVAGAGAVARTWTRSPATGARRAASVDEQLEVEVGPAPSRHARRRRPGSDAVGADAPCRRAGRREGGPRRSARRPWRRDDVGGCASVSVSHARRRRRRRACRRSGGGRAGR